MLRGNTYSPFFPYLHHLMIGILSSIVVLIVLGLTIKILGYLLKGPRDRPPLPPGPKPKPFIGNILDFPTVDLPQVYAEWGRKYNSSLVHAEALGSHVVVVNSFEDAEKLFEQTERAKIYADRPRIPVVPLMGMDYNISIMPYGDWWRRHRRICQQNFNAQAARNYESLQTKKLHQMLQGLLETPKHFDLHNKMFSVGLTIAMMYGYDIKSIDDPIVTLAEECLLTGGKLATPGGSMINVIPALRYIPAWFPGASSHKVIVKVREMTEEVIRIPVDFIKKSFEEGTVTSSLVADFYEKKFTIGSSDPDEERIVNNVALTVYAAAADTTISSTATFFYTMAISPEVQKRAHADIDRVVGSKRLPSLADRDALPYIDAIFREVMRFNPPVSLSVPHAVSEDDSYNGYFIPKGTTVLPNIWAMTHNEDVYPDPFSFKPERFLDRGGKLNGDDRVLAFGFGRRICVGKHVADSTMWLLIASVLACFNITQAKDEEGNFIEINHDYDNSGFISQKEKFECDFQIRSPAARNLLQDLNALG